MTRTLRIPAFRLAFSVAVAAIAACGLPGSLDAQTAVDPSDLYLKAYLAMRDAEQLAKDEQYNYAFEKYLEATDLIDSVATTYPSWNPHMVNFRRKKIREIITELRLKAQPALGYSLDPAPVQDSLPPLPTSALPLPDHDSFPPPPPTSHLPNVVAMIPSPETESPAPTGDDSIGAVTSHIETKFRELHARISQLDSEKQHLVRRLQSKETDLAAMRQALDTSHRSQAELENKLTESQERLKQTAAYGPDKVQALEKDITTLSAQLTIAKASLADSGIKTTELLAELEEAAAEIDLLKEERSHLITERYQMEAILGEIDSDGSASISGLMALNENLRRQLDTARENAEKLAGARTSAQEEIERLKEEVAGVSQELTDMRAENQEYQIEIAQLTAKLESVSEDLSDPAIAAGNAAALEENEMLREIILRQLRQQARRQQAKVLAIEELAKLEINSQSLLDHIEDLAGSRVMLSDKERSLFRDSYVAPLLTDSDLHGTLLSSGNSATELTNPNARVRVPTSDSRSRMAELAREASRQFEAGQHAEAESLFEEILDLDRQNIFSLCNLGIIKLQLGKHEEAEVLFSKALAYEPKYSSAHLMLGITQFNQRDFDRALESINHSVQINPNNAQAHQYLGLIASHKGWVKRAEEEFKKAIAIDPGFAEAHFNLAILYITSPEPVRARAADHYPEALNLGAAPDPVMEEYLKG